MRFSFSFTASKTQYHRGKVTSRTLFAMPPARRGQHSPRPPGPSSEHDDPRLPVDATPEVRPKSPLPKIPSPNEIHERWDPKYQAVAKCDFCHARVSHEKTAGVLQLCRDCKMSICQDCCLQIHDTTKGRLEAYERQGKAGQLTDIQRRWCQFGIQGRHTLDPDKVNWELPEKKQKPAARKARALDARRTGRGSRGGRRQGVGRGGRQQAAKRRSSRLSISRTPSEFVDDDTGSLEDADDLEDKEVLDDEEYCLPSARASRGTKHAREASRTTSPDYRVAEEAAGVLAAWSSSPRPATRDNSKRVKIAHEREIPPLSPIPPPSAPPPLLVRPSPYNQHEQHHNRPSLPSLASIFPAWRVEDSPQDRGAYPHQPGYLADERRVVARGVTPDFGFNDSASHMAHERRHDHEYPPGSYSRRRSSDGLSYDIDYTRNREEPARYYEDNRADITTPYDPAFHGVQGRHELYVPSNRPGAYASPRAYASPGISAYAPTHASRPPYTPHYAGPASPYRPNLDVVSLANELERRTRAARAANPAGRVDDYLAIEISAAWRDIRPSEGGSAWSSAPRRLDDGTAIIRAFRNCLSASYIAMFGLGIEANVVNAARSWLRNTEQGLEQSGLPVRMRMEGDSAQS